MRRLVAAALGVLGGLGAHVAFAQPAAAPPRPPNTLRAGAARVPMRVPEGTPLAGYGSWRRRLAVPDVIGWYPHAFWFKPADGVLDEVAVRALVLYVGDTRITWVAADLIAVDQRFTRQLAERLAAGGIRSGTLILSASHTHSGPGAFLSSELFGVIATDREAPAVRDAILDAMVDAVRRAGAAARDARLAVATGEGPRNVTRGRLAIEPDPALVVLKLTTTAREPLAVLWNYAIHGTTLGPRNLKLSGDVSGVVSRGLEAALGVPALFVNAAVGDVSPRRHGAAASRATGEAVLAAVRAAWDGAHAVEAVPIAVRTARVALPAPSLRVRQCTSSRVPSWVRVPIGAFLAAETELVAVALGRVTLVTLPGEPVTALGREIRDAARARWAATVIAGLSNDYLGYFVPPEDYDRVNYVTCATVYGPRFGACLAATASDLLRRLPEPGATTSDGNPACEFR